LQLSKKEKVKQEIDWHWKHKPMPPEKGAF
jgi:hypothetical protein